MPFTSQPSNETRHVLHVHSSPVILDLIRKELMAGWADPLEVLSFSDPVEAANQVLYSPDLRLDLAIVDASAQWSVDPRAVVGLLRDCHPCCPVIVTRYPESPVSADLLQFGNVHWLESPFSGAKFQELARRLLKCVLSPA